MKNKIYKFSFLLILGLSAMNVHSEVITGISDPFQFGSDASVAIPLSDLAFIIPAALIGLYTYWRYLRLRKNEAI